MKSWFFDKLPQRCVFTVYFQPKSRLYCTSTRWFRKWLWLAFRIPTGERVSKPLLFYGHHTKARWIRRNWLPGRKIKWLL